MYGLQPAADCRCVLVRHDAPCLLPLSTGMTNSISLSCYIGNDTLVSIKLSLIAHTEAVHKYLSANDTCTLYDFASPTVLCQRQPKSHQTSET